MAARALESNPLSGQVSHTEGKELEGTTCRNVTLTPSWLSCPLLWHSSTPSSTSYPQSTTTTIITTTTITTTTTTITTKIISTTTTEQYACQDGSMISIAKVCNL